MTPALRDVFSRLGKLGEQAGDREIIWNALERSLSPQDLQLLSWIFKEYGVHKQYPAFVDRIDEMKRKAEAVR